MKNSNPNGSKVESTKKSTVNLSESQRQGAIERAAEASTAAGRVHANTPSTHAHVDLISIAASKASSFALDAIAAGSVADAQYASRKAVEAAAAAGFLFSLR